MKGCQLGANPVVLRISGDGQFCHEAMKRYNKGIKLRSLISFLATLALINVISVGIIKITHGMVLDMLHKREEPVMDMTVGQHVWMNPALGSLNNSIVQRLKQATKELIHTRTDRLYMNHPMAFLGIFCKKDDLINRTIIRETSLRYNVLDIITVKFVICLPEGLGLDPLLWAEAQDHRDMYILDCVENMNDGKTFEYLINVKRDFAGYTYYGKADTDSYINFPALAVALAGAPRCRFYGGRSNYPRWSTKVHFIAGSMYLLSADLVQKFEVCGKSCVIRGKEDVRVGQVLFKWLGGQYHFADLGSRFSIFNDRDPPNSTVNPSTVQVHAVKTVEAWWKTHLAFNEHWQRSCQNVEAVLGHAEFFRGENSIAWDGTCDNP